MKDVDIQSVGKRVFWSYYVIPVIYAYLHIISHIFCIDDLQLTSEDITNIKSAGDIERPQNHWPGILAASVASSRGMVHTDCVVSFVSYPSSDACRLVLIIENLVFEAKLAVVLAINMLSEP